MLMSPTHTLTRALQTSFPDKAPLPPAALLVYLALCCHDNRGKEPRERAFAGTANILYMFDLSM